MNKDLIIKIFAVIGIAIAGTFLHEGVHILQASHIYPISICYDMGKHSIMHVDGVGLGKTSQEYLGYFVGTAFTILTSWFLLFKN